MAVRSALRRLRWIVLAFGIVLTVGCADGGDVDDFADLRPYLANGPYADLLVDCVNIEFADESCLFSDLPLLGMDAPTPDVDDVMDRVVVSHGWMGVRFQQALQTLEPDILLLLRSVTAVVIDDDINPSFYWRATGAIYLDPYFLWTTNAEKATVSKEEDYRASFGDDLSFEVFGRYVKNDDWAWEDYSLYGSEVRTIQELRYGLAALLYHELAHASDYFPPGEIAGLSRGLTVREAAISPSYTNPSTQLEIIEPLTAETLREIADVRFNGETATPAQIALPASQAAGFFEFDGANDDYSYRNSREDLAMLFEETMMRHHYDIERDVGFIPTPARPTGCESFIVAWGARNRIGRANVKSRASLVSGLLLPELDLDAFYADLPTPGALRTGVDWCESVVLGAPSPARAARAPEDAIGPGEDWGRSRRRYE